MRAQALYLLFAALFFGFSTYSQPPVPGQLAAKADWPNYDKRTQLAPKAAAATNAAAGLAAPAAPAGWRVQRDAFVGTPRLLAAKHGFLSPAANAKAALGAQRPESREIIGNFLNQHRALVGHGPEVLTNAVLKRDTVSPHSGLHTLVWEQRIHGLPVFGGILAGHVTAQGDLVNLSSQFVPAPAGIAPPAAKRISPRAALILAAQDVGENALATNNVAPGNSPASVADGGEFLACPTVRGDARVRAVWLPLDSKNLRLCYEVIFTGKTSRKMFRTLIDAGTGETWVRQNLTSSVTEATYNVYTTRSPRPMSPGFSEPNSAQPSEVPRQLATIAAWSTNASPQGWLPDAATNTVGNNVDAHLDRNNDNSPDLPRPWSTNRVFDFPLSLADSPLDHGDATTVNVFYWCNWIHDQLYDLGFTEAAGNFQTDNFNRGGLAHDPVMADVQDGADDLASNNNNSNFTCPPDGMSPTMQLYLFTGPTPYLDGGLDTEDMIHEYCHGLTMRVVGGGVGLSALQSQGMGEGWSDFYALSLLSQPGDDPDACYPFAAYITYQFFGESQNYYFGIRRFPYSTDFAKNPLTFKDIDPTKAKLHSAVPRNSAISTQADEVHNMGEVWCAALWEMRANFIRKLGFATGNQLALQIVTDSLKLCPADPTYLESRDAILRAEEVNCRGTNQFEVWSAFAKRGLGAQAECPRSATATGVVEDFTLPDDLQVMPHSSVYVTGPVGGPFVLSTNLFSLYNLGTNSIPWTADPGSFVTLSTNVGLLTPGASNTVVKLSANSLAVGAAANIYTNTVAFKNTLDGFVQPQRVIFKIGIQDQLNQFFAANDFDLAYTSLTFTPLSDGEYDTCIEPAAAFPTDPAGATVLQMSDDTYYPITLTNGASVAVYKVRTNQLYIVSNGHISLQLGENHYYWSDLTNYFGQARASALYADLNPEDGGTISYQQLNDRLVATWQNVPEWGDPRKNNFQIEMFFDGRIRMTWLNIATLNPRVGLSAGTGVPENFVETDLSASPACAPALALALPATATEGDGLLTAAGTLTVPVALGDDLVVSLESSDTTKLQVPATITLPANQTSAHFDLQIIDNPYVDGTLTVRVMAAGAGFRTARAFIKVADNDLPTLVSQFDTQGKTLSIGAPNLLYGYVVESAASLRATNWTTETNYSIAPDGQRKLLINPGAPHRFYRGHKIVAP